MRGISWTSGCHLHVAGVLLAAIGTVYGADRLVWQGGEGGIWDTKEAAWTADGGNSNVPWTNGATAVFSDSPAATGGTISVEEEVSVEDLNMSGSKSSYTFQGPGRIRFLPETDADNKRIYVISSQVIDVPVVLEGGEGALRILMLRSTQEPAEVILNGGIYETEKSWINVYGGGTLVVNGTNALTGGIAVSQGTLVFGSPAAVGKGVILYPGGHGSVIRTAGEAPIVANELRTDYMTSDRQWIFEGSVPFAVEGPVTWNGDAHTVEVRVADGLAVTFNKGLLIMAKEGKSLKKTSGGALVLNGEIRYTGTTSVETGRLILNGTTSEQRNWTVGSAGILSGTGQIMLSMDTALTSAGTLSPGMDDSVGNLRIQGNVKFTKGSKYLWNIGDPKGQSDLLSIGGRLSLGDASDAWTLAVRPAGAEPGQFVPGTYTYTIAVAQAGVASDIVERATIELDPRLPASLFEGKLRADSGKLEFILTVRAKAH